MRALPGQVFTSLSYNDDPILITPVALALRKQDVKMLSLLCSHSWGKIPMFKGHPEVERNKVVSLCLYILREDADFFKNPILTDLLNQQPDQRITSKIYSTSSVKWSLEVAEVFHAVETSKILELQQVVDTHPYTRSLLDIVKSTCVNGRSPIVDKKDIEDNGLWFSKLYFQKSLVLTALETGNWKIFEYLEAHNFNLTDLGTYMTGYDRSSKERNKFFMWYMLIRHLLKRGYFPLVHQLCQKQAIWNGPAIVGCLFTAARREDLQVIKLVADHFGDMNWFNGPKYLGCTVHGLLVNQGLQKEATLLKTYLVDFRTPAPNRYDVEEALKSVKSLEEFKNLIEDHPQWLNNPVAADRSLLMVMVTTRTFTLDRFEYIFREKKAEIDKVTQSIFGVKHNFMNMMLEEVRDITSAELLFDVLQFESVQEMLFNTHNFLSDLAKKIVSLSALKSRDETEAVRIVLLECFKATINISSLETIFFPPRSSQLDNQVFGLFEVIQNHNDLYDIAVERAFDIIGKDENKLTALVHLLVVYSKSIHRSAEPHGTTQVNQLALFMTLFYKLQDKDKGQMAGYTSSLEDWQDQYGMTFLMRLLSDTEDNRHVNKVLPWIIEEKVFNEDYINHQADMELGPWFNLQHILGVASPNKERNTVISKDQVFKVKRVHRLNKESGNYEPDIPDRKGQIKMISVDKIKVKEGDNEKESRVKITVGDIDQERNKRKSNEGVIGESLSLDEEENLSEDKTTDCISQLDHAVCDLGEAVSLDGDDSEAEDKSNGCIPELDLPIYSLEKKIGQWTVDNIKESKLGKIVEPEHFDRTSVITDSNETFMTKENKYKFAASASTRIMETHSTVEAQSKHYARGTTLMLLACKFHRWDVVKSLLNSYIIDVNHKDADGSNALHLAIVAGEVEICELMINIIEPKDLKSVVNYENKHALNLVCELMEKWTLNSSAQKIENLIYKRTGQKKKTKKIKVDKTKTQQLILLGQSCGFLFQLVGGVWICLGENCTVQVMAPGGKLRAEDGNHYTRYGYFYRLSEPYLVIYRHTCSTSVKVEQRKKWKVLDQFKFTFPDGKAKVVTTLYILLHSDSDDSDVDADTEEWECKKEDCGAIIEVNKNNVLVGHKGNHTCETILEMKFSNFGLLDTYTFLKDEGTFLLSQFHIDPIVLQETMLRAKAPGGVRGLAAREKKGAARL